MGTVGDAETSGGGRIVLYADSLVMQGNGVSLKADALPYKNTTLSYNLNGGSGGYIYVNTINNLKSNSLGPNFTIKAQGGFATNGGSGGVIVLDGGFQVLES